MLLTLTFVTGVPSAFGATLPVTVTLPAPFWIRLRIGDVTVSTGGLGTSAGALVQAARREATMKVRMADDLFSKSPANPHVRGLAH